MSILEDLHNLRHPFANSHFDPGRIASRKQCPEIEIKDLFQMPSSRDYFLTMAGTSLISAQKR